MIKSVWDTLSQFLNCKTPQSLEYAGIIKFLPDPFDLGNFLWQSISQTQGSSGKYPLRSDELQWNTLPRPPAESLTWIWSCHQAYPKGHCRSQQNGYAIVGKLRALPILSLSVPFKSTYGRSLWHSKTHSSSLELMVCLNLTDIWTLSFHISLFALTTRKLRKTLICFKRILFIVGTLWTNLYPGCA